jgi:hypothetical protein
LDIVNVINWQVEITKLQNMDKMLRMDQTNKIKYIEGKNRVRDKKATDRKAGSL